MALYAAYLIKSNAPLSALKLLCMYGAPASPQYFNIYKKLCLEVFSSSNEGPGAYMHARPMLSLRHASTIGNWRDDCINIFF